MNRKTVPSLIQTGAEDIDLGNPLEVSRAKAHYRKIIQESWRRLKDKNLSVNSHNIPAYLSQAAHAQARLDRLNGIEAPIRQEITHKRTVADIARVTEGIPPEQRLRVVDGGL